MMEIDPDKLEELFRERYETLQDDSEAWIDYCDKHGIVILHPEWVREEFNKDHKNMVCIFSPEENESLLWLLVPKEFAEKGLALGGLL